MENSEQKQTYPPGFEPPTDVDVPWYAWVIWPFAIIGVVLVAGALLRGCMGWMAG